LFNRIRPYVIADTGFYIICNLLTHVEGAVFATSHFKNIFLQALAQQVVNSFAVSLISHKCIHNPIYVLN
jgi:hypothetical protein